MPNIVSTDRSNECEVIISGRIVNTKNLEPLEDARIEARQFGKLLFETTTDEDGVFSVELSLTEADTLVDIEVTKQGFLIKEFKAYLGSVVQFGTCPLVTNISWDIALSERKQGVQTGPKDGAWYKVMDTVATIINADTELLDGEMELNSEGEAIDTAFTTTIYVIDIHRGSLDDVSVVFVSPDNSRAIGPGIPPEVRPFLVDLFRIEVNPDLNNFLSASSRNTLIFNKPIDIRWFVGDLYDGSMLSSIDLEDLGLEDEEVTINADGEIIFLTDEDGLQGIGETPFVEEIVIPVLEAILNEESIELIEMALLDGLETIGNLTGNPTGIFTDTDSEGRTANQETLLNCGCGAPSFGSFSAELEGFENIIITSPPITSEEAQQAFNIIRTLVGASVDNDQAVSVNVPLDMCQAKTVTAQEIVRTVTGVVMGFPFTYQATDRLETTDVATNCPTTTPCHQGCPG